MLGRRLLHRLEILFWDALIKLMGEAPDFSRFIIQTRYFIRSKGFYRLTSRAVIWSLLGLTLGFILGLLSRFIC